MADGAVKHDYHLVEPSPWPLLGSIALFFLAIGFVVLMKGFVLDDKSPLFFFLGQGKPWLSLLGFVLVGWTMIGWWGDVVKESHKGDHTPVVELGLRYGMILFIASEVMFFVGWFWFFFDIGLFHELRTTEFLDENVQASWKTFPPQGVEPVHAFGLPLINTLILLLSGTTVTWAHHALQTGNRREADLGLMLTVLLGFVFLGVQGYEYYHILHESYFYGNPAAEAYGSGFFMATGFHGAHVLIGAVFLLVCWLRLKAGHFSPQKHFGFEAAAWYWHFVDVVWLFLFAFVYVLFG